MMRQNNFIPSSDCCCRCKIHHDDPSFVNGNDKIRDNLNTTKEEYYRNRNGRPYSYEFEVCDDGELDDETMQAFETMRQKACRFISSETDCSIGIDSTCRPCDCHQASTEREENMLKRARDSLDYAPQSEFLKKFKNHIQCQCLQNGEQRQGLSKSNDFIPKICEECIAKSNQIIKLLEQLHKQGREATENYNDHCRSCRCSREQEQRRIGITRIVKTCRSVVDDLKNVLTSVGPCRDSDCCNQDQLEISQPINNQLQKAQDDYSVQKEKLDNSKSKSQHVSRSKKRVKCRDRKKRKSNGSEQCLSQENFEPSLKQPHENSCERCWRYASPSRSPVNKPAQRYDPNFRRAHSCQDFLSTEGRPSEITSAPGTPDRSQPWAHCRTRELDQSSTKVKELMIDSFEVRSPRSRQQRERFSNEKSRSVGQSDENQRPRPKSCSPGISSADRRNISALAACFDQYAGSDSKEAKFRKSLPRDVGSRNEPDLDPLCLREDQEVLRNQETYGSTPRTGNDFSQNSSLSAHKRENTTTQRKPGLKAQNFSSTPNSLPCAECKCKKTSVTKSDSSKQSPQPMNVSSPKEARGSPARTNSSAQLRNKNKTPPGKRPRTADQSGKKCSSNRLQNRSAKGNEWSQKEKRTNVGEFKCCDCRSKTPKPSFSVSPRNPEGVTFSIPQPTCCHCRDNKEFPDQTGSHNKNTPAIKQTPIENNDDNYSWNVNDPECDRQNNSFPDRQDFYGVDNFQTHPMRRVPCSYLPTMDENQDFPSSIRYPDSYQENQRYYSNLNETYPPAARANCPPRNRNSNSCHSAPKKYCVFYMTKSKGDRGNEVEVLVEELTERCKPNDSRFTALKDKMKRFEEGPSDSMALRYQRGVKEPSRHRPDAGKILYF